MTESISQPVDRAPPRAPGRERRAIAAVLVVLLLVVAGLVGLAVRSPRVPPALLPSQVPISHVVILMMENHAFDNLFGAYCPQVGPACPAAANGLPPGTCVPYDPSNPSTGCIRPYPFGANQLSTASPPHEWNSSLGSIDGGAMNGFYPAERSGVLPFGYYDGSTVPIYYDIAQEFALGDDFFSSALSYSLPNHWYLLAGQAPPVGGVNITALHTTYEKERYLDSANATRTVQDLLNVTPAVSWKYYDWPLPPYTAAIAGSAGLAENSAYNNWAPLAARAESYTTWYAGHFVNRTTFFGDAAAGALPNISWVMPGVPFSDHPAANLSAGEAYVASVLDAVEGSPEWDSTAVFVTWDDYGGFYDHMPPPVLDGLGLSLRVPILVVSPYTPRGLVVHDLGYFESLLRFVEWRFGLGCLTARDCNAPLPLGYFDFSALPRAPVLFPTNSSLATYPMAAAAIVPSVGTGSGVPMGPGGPFAIDPSRWATAPPPANVSNDAID